MSKIREKLSTDAIESILNETFVDAPIFEILLLTITSKTTEDIDMTRIILTDGIESISGIIASDCSILPPNHILQIHSVVRLLNYEISRRGGRFELLVYSLEVVYEPTDQPNCSDQQVEATNPLKRPRTTTEINEPLDFVEKSLLEKLPETEVIIQDMRTAVDDLLSAVRKDLRELNTVEKEWQIIESNGKQISDGAPNIIKLDLRGKLFKVRKEVLLSAKYSVFHAMLSTDIFQPNQEGVYFFDVASESFERILEFLEGGVQCLEGLPAYEERLVALFKKIFFIDVPEKDESDEGGEGVDGTETKPERWFINGAEKKIFNGIKYTENYLIAIFLHSIAVKNRINHWREVLEQLLVFSAAAVSDIICLDLRGKAFKTRRDTLMKIEGSYFHALLSSGSWLPDQEGVYFIDRWHYGFERLIEYMSSGYLSFAGLTAREIDCIEANMEYFQLKRPTIYKGHEDSILSLMSLIELQDGRLCSSSYDGKIIVWAKNTNECELIITVQESDYVSVHVTQLSDGSLCCWSYDGSIKLWSLSSGTCTKSIGIEKGVDLIKESPSNWLYAVVRAKSNSDSDSVYMYCQNFVFQKKWTLTKHINCLTILKNESLVVGSPSTRVVVCNDSTTLILSGHTGPVVLVAEINDDWFCSAAASDPLLRIWNSNTLELVKLMPCDGISALYFGQFLRNSLFYFYCKSERVLKYIDVNVPPEECVPVICPIKFDDESSVKIVLPLSDGASICTDYKGESFRVWHAT